MAARMVLNGVGVSGGVAVAPVLAIVGGLTAPCSQRTPERGRAGLEAAITAASESLIALMETVEGAAADILEFQIVVLEDEEILEPVFTAVSAGQAADEAWRNRLDLEIAACAGGGPDDAFAARAADLTDIRDRVLSFLSGAGAEQIQIEEPSIIVAADLAPSRFLQIAPENIAGVVLGGGSRTSHVALLAQARSVPLIVGAGDVSKAAETARGLAVLDAGNGCLILNPSAAERTAAEQRRSADSRKTKRAVALASRPAITVDGERIHVMMNVDHPFVLDSTGPGHCDGIGLTRTEFLFSGGLPDEDAQAVVYERIVEWAAGRPVTFRTLDAGGDKPVAGITPSGETNPFLGVRGVRLSLLDEDLFSVQLRALLRAAAKGPVKIMVPMVTLPQEMTQVRTLTAKAAAELAGRGAAHTLPAVGMMVETPAAAMAAEIFDADFYSIGTNDLIQYATASARDNPGVSHLARADHPGVLRMIEAVAETGRRRGVEVSVCGDMASNSGGVHHLIRAGVRTISTAPGALACVKAAIADFSKGAAP